MTKTLIQYKVTADRATGEWLGEPTLVRTVRASEWALRQDTDAVHYDTYQDEEGYTRAIEVHWIQSPTS